MKKAFITGANKSIGFETARQLLQEDFYVYLGSRDMQKGEAAVERLKAEGLEQAEAIEIDVESFDSIRAAREVLGRKTDVLDVLINNAGISGGMPQTALGTDIGVYQKVFQTNFFGLVFITQTFIDLMKPAAEPRIVNVTSGTASLTLQNDPSWKYYAYKGSVYVPSKVAVNGYTVALAYELRDTAFKVNAVDPGFTATDFNNHRGTGTVADAAARLVKAATFGPNGPTGQFLSDDNAPDTGVSPW